MNVSLIKSLTRPGFFTNIGWLAILCSSAVTVCLFWLAKQQYPAFTNWVLGTQFTGTIGLFWLCWAYVLSMRHSWLEKWFNGIDRAYKAHHFIAVTAFFTLLIHPLLMVFQDLPANSFALYLLPGTYFPFNLGIVALYVMLFLVVLTIVIDLPYWIWKQTHEWMGVVLLLGGAHGILVASDLSKYLPLQLWMVIWVLIATAAIIYKRFLYYWLTPPCNYQVEKLQKENGTLIITLKPQLHSHAIQLRPGQFGFLSIPNVGRDHDEHPFSLMEQSAQTISFGIKIYGTFTETLTTLKPGAAVTLRGPFGQFGEHLLQAKQQVWIAGGIGVTPFISLLSEIQPNQSVTLIYANRGPAPALFTAKIKQFFAKNKKCMYVEHDTATHGRLTADKITEYAELTAKTRVWLCGPPPMMMELEKQLPIHGIKKKYIYFEDFSLK